MEIIGIPLLIALVVKIGRTWVLTTYHFPRQRYAGHYSGSDSENSVYLRGLPDGDIGVEVVPVIVVSKEDGEKKEHEKRKYLNGRAIVNVYGYGENSHQPIQPRIATYLRESARTHWWLFWRYHYVGDVVEEMKCLLDKRVDRLERTRQLLKAKEDAAKSLDERTKNAIKQFCSDLPASPGALSKADAAGGEVTPAQSGEMSNVIEMRPSSETPQKK